MIQKQTIDLITLKEHKYPESLITKQRVNIKFNAVRPLTLL